jgi:hypothetical protein
MAAAAAPTAKAASATASGIQALKLCITKVALFYLMKFYKKICLIH